MSTTSETVVVTPDVAENWLAHNLYERQRRLSEFQVQRLSREMEKRRFTEGTPIHFAVLRGRELLINGQHTLTAVSRSGIPQVLTIVRNVTQSDDEVAALYSRHDRHRGRTTHDGFVAMGLGDKYELSASEVNAFSSGLRLLVNGFRKVTTSDDPELYGSTETMAGHMDQWQEIGRQYFEAVRDAGRGLVGAYRRSAVVAIGLATFTSDKPVEDVAEFWRTAAKNSDLMNDDPRAVLSTFLLSNTVSARQPAAYMRYVARCWNSHYEGKQIKLLRAGDHGKIGVTIAGTDYKAWRKQDVKRQERADAAQLVMFTVDEERPTL